MAAAIISSALTDAYTRRKYCLMCGYVGTRWGIPTMLCYENKAHAKSLAPTILANDCWWWDVIMLYQRQEDDRARCLFIAQIVECLWLGDPSVVGHSFNWLGQCRNDNHHEADQRQTTYNPQETRPSSNARPTFKCLSPSLPK